MSFGKWLNHKYVRLTFKWVTKFEVVFTDPDMVLAQYLHLALTGSDPVSVSLDGMSKCSKTLADISTDFHLIKTNIHFNSTRVCILISINTIMNKKYGDIL